MTCGLAPLKASEAYSKYGSIGQFQEEFEDTIDNYFEDKSKLSAIGKCGLDFYQLKFSPIKEQLEVLDVHFKMAKRYG